MRRSLGAVALALLGTLACNVWSVKRTVVAPTALNIVNSTGPFLKAHQRDGSVYILRSWRLDTAAHVISGTGEHLDAYRRKLAEGPLRASVDSTVVIESNEVSRHASVAAMTFLSGLSAAVTLGCALNPKSCFGSCPTFYVSDGERQVLQAEGFSSSIAPVLEATDVDALYRARPGSRTFTVRMTNEALETHVVRYVDVLAVPRSAGGRAFASDNSTFWRASAITRPSACRAGAASCTQAVTAVDGTEWFDSADSTDLSAREVIDLEFPAVPTQRAGLVIGSRQTLLTTFLMYQTYAWLGSTLGDFIARLQRGDLGALAQLRALRNTLGTIEVQVPDGAEGWKTVGSAGEVGPIAEDVRVVPLPALPPDARRLRLRLTKGLWRIDYVALATLDGPVQPLRLLPERVLRDGSDDAAVLTAMRARSAPLTTTTGDHFDFEYRLPANFANLELFLETRGYYLEWMRDAWLAEEDAPRAAALLRDPHAALRALAPAFKRQEVKMEDAFWSSRYVRP